MTSILFTVIDDQIVLRGKNGIYKQARLAHRAGHVFAKVAGGFVQVYTNGTTSHPDYRWLDMEGGDQYVPGSLGRLTVRTGAAS